MARFIRFLIFSFLIAISFSACAPLRGPDMLLRLYVFDCGKIEIADSSGISPGIGRGQKTIFANSCYLIVHPKGLLLWDTGLPDALVKNPLGVTNKGFTFSVQNPLVSQLAEVGYRPNDIGLVGFSHMHPDHTGNANLFSHSTILMQKEEHDAAFGPEPGKYQFNFVTYQALKESRFIKLQGDYDVFDDRRVVIKRAIGHTPGHQMLYVKLSETGGVLLSGDLVHSWDNWVNNRVPLFNYDKEHSLQAMKEVREFLKTSGAQLWIQHNLEQSLTLKRAPSYYE